MTAPLPQHPERFRKFVARTLRREFALRVESLRLATGQSPAPRPEVHRMLLGDEFRSMAPSEIAARGQREASLEAMIHQWRDAGRLIFDISESLAQCAHPSASELPDLAEVPASFFVNFGIQKALRTAGGGFIDGAYVSVTSAGVLKFALVSTPRSDSAENLAEILRDQPRVAIGALNSTVSLGAIDALPALDIEEELRPVLLEAMCTLIYSINRIACSRTWHAAVSRRR